MFYSLYMVTITDTWAYVVNRSQKMGSVFKPALTQHWATLKQRSVCSNTVLQNVDN